MLTGKGVFIWQIERCEGGDVQEIAGKAAVAKMSHLLIKISDGPWNYNVTEDGVDLARKLANACRDVGVSPWGWQYVYGDDPLGEAAKAFDRAKEVGIDGFVINAEGHYKGKTDQAKTYAKHLGLGEIMPVALSSYRYPQFHMELPWWQFLKISDFVMPQVYFIQGEPTQLEESQMDYDALFDQLEISRPFFPTGPAFYHNQTDWQPTEEQLIEFMNLAVESYDGFNFWEWAAMKQHGYWPAIRDYQMPEPTPEPPSELEQRVADLESKIQLMGQRDDTFEARITRNTARVESLSTLVGEQGDALRKLRNRVVDLEASDETQNKNIENNAVDAGKAIDAGKHALELAQEVDADFSNLKKFVNEKVNILNEDIQELDQNLEEHTHDDNGEVSNPCGLICWLRNLWR